jgi:hypothetical protein
MIDELGLRRIPCKLPQLVDYMLWYHECSGLSHPWLLSRGDSRIAVENFIHLHTCFQREDSRGIRVHFTSHLSNSKLQIFGNILSKPHTLYLHSTHDGSVVKFDTPRLEHANPSYRVSIGVSQDQFRAELYHCIVRTHFPEGVTFERAYRIRIHIASRHYQPDWLAEGKKVAKQIATDLMHEKAGNENAPSVGLREVSHNSVRVQGIRPTDLEQEAQIAHPELWNTYQDILVGKSAVLEGIFGQQKPPPVDIICNAAHTENISPAQIRSQVPSRLDSSYACSPVDTTRLHVTKSTPPPHKRTRHSYDDESGSEEDDCLPRISSTHSYKRRLNASTTDSDKENEDMSFVSPRLGFSHYREMRDLELRFSHQMNEVLAENRKLRAQIQDLNNEKNSNICLDHAVVFPGDETVGEDLPQPKVRGRAAGDNVPGAHVGNVLHNKKSRHYLPLQSGIQGFHPNPRDRALRRAMGSFSSLASFDQTFYELAYGGGKGKQKVDDSLQDSLMKEFELNLEPPAVIPDQNEIKRNYAEFLEKIDREAVRAAGAGISRFSDSDSGPNSSYLGYISSGSKAAEDPMDWDRILCASPASLRTAEIPLPADSLLEEDTAALLDSKW